MTEQPGGVRLRLWPAIWATVITFTVVVTAGGILLGARLLQDRPERITRLGVVTATPPTTTRLVVTPAIRLVDAATRPGAELPVPIAGVPAGSTALLLDVSVTGAAAAGDVSLGTTPALRTPAAGAQASATVVVRLAAGGPPRVRTAAGGRLIVTLAGAFVPATDATAGRIVPVPPELALVLQPPKEHRNTATIDAAALDLGGAAPGALLLSFTADVGVHGGRLAVGGQTIYWAATSGKDRVRSGFLVVPVGSGRIPLTYHAGTVLTVSAVGYVTGKGAARSTTGLSVPADPTTLPPLTVPPGGRTDVALPDAGSATAALTTATLTPAAGTPRSVLTLLAVHAGKARLTGPGGAEITLTPRLLIH